MTTHSQRVLLTARIAAAGLLGSMALGAGAFQRDPKSAATERARIVFSHKLPRLDGNQLEAKLVDVTYGPGESSSPHTHPCPIVGYVIEGAVRMRVGSEPEVVYKAGDGFYEGANAQHLVSANASSSNRARFLAYFTCDHDAPLSAPIRHAGQ